MSMENGGENRRASVEQNHRESVSDHLEQDGKEPPLTLIHKGQHNQLLQQLQQQQLQRQQFEQQKQQQIEDVQLFFSSRGSIGAANDLQGILFRGAARKLLAVSNTWHWCPECPDPIACTDGISPDPI